MRAYSELLRFPGITALLAASLLARAPIGVNGLAIVLFLEAETGSFAAAGIASGALALGVGFGAPVGARLVDRFGARVLLGFAAVHAAGLLGFVALAVGDAPVPALAVLAGLCGLALPPTPSVLRARYPQLLGERPALVQTAFALDSVLTEASFVLGPLVVAVCLAVADPGAPLLFSAVAVVLGTAAFLAALPASEPVAVPEGAAPAGRLGALASPGVRTLIAAMLPVGFAFGAVEVAVPAYADAQGRPELAGLLLAAWASASVAGGLAYGARPRRRSLAQVHLRMAVALPLGFLPVALAGPPVTMVLLLVPAGLFIAPLLATRNELAGVVALPGTETEAVTWPLTTLVSGIALGAATAGLLVDASGWQAAALAGGLGAVAAAIVALARRGTLRPTRAEVPAPA